MSTHTSFGIQPYVVFDGANLPSKQHTEAHRAQRRAEALDRGRTLLAQGQLAAARDAFLKACDVTPQMAYQVRWPLVSLPALSRPSPHLMYAPAHTQMIKQLQAAHIPYVVAPYEADAQLCYLENQGLVHAVLTEDSDLLVFGCRTVLCKWDKEGGVHEFKQDRLARCPDFRLDGFSQQHFRQCVVPGLFQRSEVFLLIPFLNSMAILSGCDYLPSIPRVGLKLAHKCASETC